MRILLFGIVLFTSLSALALPVYNCDLTVVAKGDRTQYVWTKKLLLSPAFTNTQDFHNTKVELRVQASGVLAGAVNGQPNFLISGDVYQGQFESAFHKGTVKCDSMGQLPFVFQFKPWKQYFTVDAFVSQGHIQNSVSLSQIDHNLLCFMGDAALAFKFLSENLNAQARFVDEYEIEMSWTQKDCVRSIGTNPDDIECVEYQDRARTRKVMSCNGRPDPRS
ncbi:MAG: hypothetical protein LW878_00565 [Proteobacteria bacterium]|nr:hypothetical protein [Pseudomonadota bacterium]